MAGQVVTMGGAGGFGAILYRCQKDIGLSCNNEFTALFLGG
jgi:hypothetical protein